MTRPTDSQLLTVALVIYVIGGFYSFPIYKAKAQTPYHLIQEVLPKRIIVNVISDQTDYSINLPNRDSSAAGPLVYSGGLLYCETIDYYIEAAKIRFINPVSAGTIVQIIYW